MSARYRDPEWLRRTYRDEGLTQREIAEACDVSPRTIREYMNEYGIETREVAGENHPLYGEERSAETKRKISQTLEGRSLSAETRESIADAQRGRPLPDDVREAISESLTGLDRSEETRERMSRSTAGEDNPNWKGGYSCRYGPGWAVARDRVRDRDEVCQHCGHDGHERRLEVHHIVPMRRFREIDAIPISDAHDERNLVLLCRRCHGKAEHGVIDVTTRNG